MQTYRSGGTLRKNKKGKRLTTLRDSNEANQENRQLPGELVHQNKRGNYKFYKRRYQ